MNNTNESEKPILGGVFDHVAGCRAPDHGECICVKILKQSCAEKEAEAAAMREALLPFTAWAARLVGPNKLGDSCLLSVDPTRLASLVSIPGIIHKDPIIADLRKTEQALSSTAGAEMLAEMEVAKDATQFFQQKCADLMILRDADLAEMEELKAKHEETSAHFEEMVRQTNLERIEADRLKDDSIKLRESNVDIIAREAQSAAEAARLKVENAELLASLKSARDSNAILRSEADEDEAELNKLKAELATLKSSYDTVSSAGSLERQANDKLNAELAQVHGLLEHREMEYDTERRWNADLKQANDRLRKALDKYGDHLNSCEARWRIGDPCTCGFDAALEGAATRERRSREA